MNMDVAVVCEESQAVTIELRKLGHKAFSIDLLPCSGGHPEWHIQSDAVPLLNQGWDLIIAFPPCTHLACSGARWFYEKSKTGLQKQGYEFFMKIVNAKCPKIGIENPIGVMSTLYRKPDQIINPYQFGHMEQKSTCIWVKNLPLLVETNNVYTEMMKLPQRERERNHWLGPSPNRSVLRSKTYLGIAKAMAEQWTNVDNKLFIHSLF